MRKNENIGNKTVRVVSDNGIGCEISLKEALSEAESRGLDLVEMREKDGVSVCKIMDYSKHIYTREKSVKSGKSARTVTKEIRLGMNIACGDIAVKARQTERFLEKGYKVKVSVVFKGRQADRKQRGESVLDSFLSCLKGYAVEKPASMQGNRYGVEIRKEKGNK